MEGFGKVSAAANYAGVSVRTFREWLKDQRLRRVVMPTGTILLKYRWVDTYLTTFEPSKSDSSDIDRIVDDAVEGLLK